MHKVLWGLVVAGAIGAGAFGTVGCDNKQTGVQPEGAQQMGAQGGSTASQDEGPPKYAIRKIGTKIEAPDPNAPYWKEAAVHSVALQAQPLIAPRPEVTNTDKVLLSAVHDGDWAAFLLRWKDADQSEAGILGEYSDAVALQFPVNDPEETSVFMGSPDNPVHIFHWRAQYQRDLEKGKPEMKDLYPNMNVDMYQMDFKEAPGGTPEQQEAFMPGRAEGNPQSYDKTGVDEVVAEGFATSAVQEGTGARAKGIWKDGEWAVVILRPIDIEGGSSLRHPKGSAVALAAWQGGKEEVGSRKCVTMSWLGLEVAP